MESLFVLFIFCNPNDNSDVGSVFMVAHFGAAACSLMLAILATYCGMQSGGRKLTYIMMVAICNVCAEYGHRTVKQTYENVLNNAVKVTTGLFCWLSLTQPSESWRILACVMAGMLTITPV